jgi:hypothetical protein
MGDLDAVILNRKGSLNIVFRHLNIPSVKHCLEKPGFFPSIIASFTQLSLSPENSFELLGFIIFELTKAQFLLIRGCIPSTSCRWQSLARLRINLVRILRALPSSSPSNGFESNWTTVARSCSSY